MRKLNKYFVFFGILVLAFFVSLAISQAIFKVSGEVILDNKLTVDLDADDETFEGVVKGVESSCDDNDGGLNYGVFGSAKYCDGEGNCRNEEDYCSSGRLNEWFCENGNLAVERLHSCANGICSKGECKKIIGGGGGGSGSSSGGSSSPITVGVGENYIWEDSVELFRVQLSEEDSVSFNVLGVGYDFVLDEISSVSVLASISGNGQISVNVGEERGVDLDSDDISDIVIKLKSINLLTNNANLDFMRF
jgi:hypothetical protein